MAGEISHRLQRARRCAKRPGPWPWRAGNAVTELSTSSPSVQAAIAATCTILIQEYNIGYDGRGPRAPGRPSGISSGWRPRS
ncbi:Uncharacterised protein [Bordetella pertussis]|nr:Uncharacterised protein [Bordetella pertussis]CFW00556.1 Uncharacterised protein [Bordetella pertussis]